MMYTKSFPDTEQLYDRLLLALRPFISSFLTVKVRHTFRMVRIVKSLCSLNVVIRSIVLFHQLYNVHMYIACIHVLFITSIEQGLWIALYLDDLALV